MVAVDRHDRVVRGELGKLTQSTPPHSRRQWVAPTWERLETPMEVTMYVSRR